MHLTAVEAAQQAIAQASRSSRAEREHLQRVLQQDPQTASMIQQWSGGDASVAAGLAAVLGGSEAERAHLWDGAWTDDEVSLRDLSYLTQAPGKQHRTQGPLRRAADREELWNVMSKSSRIATHAAADPDQRPGTVMVQEAVPLSDRIGEGDGRDGIARYLHFEHGPPRGWSWRQVLGDEAISRLGPFVRAYLQRDNSGDAAWIQSVQPFNGSLGDAVQNEIWAILVEEGASLYHRKSGIPPATVLALEDVVAAWHQMAQRVSDRILREHRFHLQGRKPTKPANPFSTVSLDPLGPAGTAAPGAVFGPRARRAADQRVVNSDMAWIMGMGEEGNVTEADQDPEDSLEAFQQMQRGRRGFIPGRRSLPS